MAYTQETFLKVIKPFVIEDMKKSGILASLTAAQACLESGHGNSKLTIKANNLFGIKGKYNGQYVIMPTKEWDGAKYITINAAFKKYPSWTESIADHSAMFNRLSRYKNLRGCTDWQKAIIYVKQDGYCTDPNYTAKLQVLIMDNMLYKWDAEAGAEVKPINGNPYTEPTKVVKLNSKGNDVRWCQFELNRRGYKLVVDGKAGQLTIGALIDFQKKAFPDEPNEWDGICGAKTRKALKSFS